MSTTNDPCPECGQSMRLNLGPVLCKDCGIEYCLPCAIEGGRIVDQASKTNEDGSKDFWLVFDCGCSNRAEAAEERRLEAYYGGSGPQTFAEQLETAREEKRRLG